MPRYLYLHGFASSPASSKAQYLKDRFGERGLTLEIPALDEGDFEHLTLTKQLALIERLTQGQPTHLLGSSMGGYLAALYAVNHPNVLSLVLLAPAFGFLDRWGQQMGPAKVAEWKAANALPVYHYGDLRTRSLTFDLFADAVNHPPYPDFTQPALIIHGVHDDIVPVEHSRRFAASHPNAQLHEVDDTHELRKSLPQIWRLTQQFISGGL